ncbi:hypothetical protein GGR57DRAFT_460445 [Xylariaceae sp. FL1272]|nr:hypothetical protein GGR57DRAFT_460445 [Xylariaceae sp. FL1272]
MSPSRAYISGSASRQNVSQLLSLQQSLHGISHWNVEEKTRCNVVYHSSSSSCGIGFELVGLLQYPGCDTSDFWFGRAEPRVHTRKKRGPCWQFIDLAACYATGSFKLRMYTSRSIPTGGMLYDIGARDIHELAAILFICDDTSRTDLVHSRLSLINQACRTTLKSHGMPLEPLELNVGLVDGALVGTPVPCLWGRGWRWDKSQS